MGAIVESLCCKAPECEKDPYCKGFCRTHYEQVARGTYGKICKRPKTCMLEGCSEKHVARGLCKNHYYQFRNEGRAMLPSIRDIPFTPPPKRKNLVGQEGCQIPGCQGKYKARKYCQRHYNTIKDFGIPPEVPDNLHKAQAGLCAICKKEPGGKGLHLDHNHATREVRTMLCYRCNIALGFFNEDPELFLRLAEYAETDGKCIKTRQYGVYIDPDSPRNRPRGR